MSQIIRQGIAAKWRSERMRNVRKSIAEQSKIQRKWLFEDGFDSKLLEKWQKPILADYRRIRKSFVFGKKFLATFPEIEVRGKKRNKFVVLASDSEHETPMSIALKVQNAPKPKRLPGAWNPRVMQGKLAEAKLEFDGKNVIMSFQGKQLTERGQKVKPLLDLFRSCTGRSWAEFLVESVEDHAKNCGFKKCVIRRPESLYFYKKPAIIGENGMPRRVATPEEAARIREQMHKLYDGTALSMHYRKEGEFWVKDL